MTNLIIYTDTHRDACIDTGTDMDAAVYDEHIDAYYEFLKAEAEKADIELRFETGGSGRSTYTESNDGEEFLEQQPDFWQWLN